MLTGVRATGALSGNMPFKATITYLIVFLSIFTSLLVIDQVLAALSFVGGIFLAFWYTSRLRSTAPARNSRYRRLRANGGKHTDKQWRMLLRRYRYRCASCDRNDVPLTKDHIVPVSKGGSDDISNIQPLCTSCNSRKGVKIIRY